MLMAFSTGKWVIYDNGHFTSGTASILRAKCAGEPVSMYRGMFRSNASA
jgi:hypothetical protein